MPNYIKNILEMTGDSGILRKILGVDKKNKINFSFSNMVPAPDNVNMSNSLLDSKWFVENWGTKWDACNWQTNYNGKDNKFIITFITAWSPPIEWLKKIINIFANIECMLSYCDVDNLPHYYGFLEYKNGCINEQIYNGDDYKNGFDFLKEKFSDLYGEYEKDKKIDDLIKIIKQDFKENICKQKNTNLHFSVDNYQIYRVSVDIKPVSYKKLKTDKVYAEKQKNKKIKLLPSIKTLMEKNGFECEINDTVINIRD